MIIKLRNNYTLHIWHHSSTNYFKTNYNSFDLFSIRTPEGQALRYFIRNQFRSYRRYRKNCKIWKNTLQEDVAWDSIPLYKLIKFKLELMENYFNSDHVITVDEIENKDLGRLESVRQAKEAIAGAINEDNYAVIETQLKKFADIFKEYSIYWWD